MGIGTDIDILLSSFDATDANHDQGKQKQGLGSAFPSVCVPLAGWELC